MDEFERAVADFCGARHGVAFSNGTVALHAACIVAGVGEGANAITTPLTFAATSNAVVYCGATPIFADIYAETLNIDPQAIAQKITKDTKAILPVDFSGQPADLEAILDLASRNNIAVIEDACHALGSSFKTRPVGSISHMTVFSFHPVKHITTGEGGMVTTNDDELMRKLRRIRHHGISYPNQQKKWRYEINELGYNYRLPDLNCALGVNQLKRLAAGIDRRNTIAARYHEAFSKIPEVLLPSVRPDVRHAWHLYIVRLNLEKLTADRDTVIEALRAENIGATLHYPLIHLQPFYRQRFGLGPGVCPVAESVADTMLTLPLFEGMSDRDVNDVIQAVSKVVRAFHA